ncbi:MULTISPECIES: class I SAM-dependent methyltransferase [unclassified Thioalkalivibrio]|uniref:class I SAM-dependent methyltransferase n=1 Tax=unclassified Thioalkalivibrio TaxID=2621013 RepID=UPI00036815AD|nr:MULTISPECIES: class I SAM-dependent methyltransferase [unclassified Thioalkalivibrio]
MTLQVRAEPGQEVRAREIDRYLHAQGYRHPGKAPLVLEVGAHGLSLIREEGRRELCLHLDFATGRQGYRLAHSGHQREGLIRAMGNIARDSHVVDATAGLGRDTLLLAAHGFRVDAWERHPVVYLLLADALQRAAHDEALAPIVERITLHAGLAAPATLSTPPVAAVFDPMFPERAKRAAVKKDMQLTQALMEGDPDPEPETTLQRLREAATRRVVVKRPLHAPALGPDTPQGSVRGKSVRFDVYAPAAQS